VLGLRSLLGHSRQDTISVLWVVEGSSTRVGKQLHLC